MAHNEVVVVAFVASPSDVEDERNKLEEVVRELNLTWGNTLGARLDLVRWETHAFPGVGQDAQDVINRQIGEEYDIFIGIMWGRFGSPTERAESGTEEEFLRALQRHKAGSDVRIMFYFKDTPIEPSKLDPEQHRKIQSFKSNIGDKGVFHWSFQTVEEFEGLLRLHLARQMQGFQKTDDAESKTTLPVANAVDARPLEDDAGILDLMEEVEEHFQTVNEIVMGIGAETEGLGKRISQRTAEITDAADGANGKLSRSEAKRLINKAADDMNRYVTRAGAEIPSLRELLGKGLRALGKAMTLAVDFDQGDHSKFKEVRESVTSLETALEDTHESISGFRLSIQSLPRITTKLNKAKRSVLVILDELLQGLEDGRRDANEAAKVLDEILSEELKDSESN